MDLKTMGKRIKAARECAGLTQDELAEAIEMSPMHISVIERGVKPPKLETFIKIANTLKVSADELLQDNVDEAIVSRTNNMAQLIEDLPVKERRRVLAIVKAFLDSYQTDE